MWNKEEFAQRERKKFCSNYSGVSLSPSTCWVLSNVLLLMVTPYLYEITEKRHYVFLSNVKLNDSDVLQS